MTPYQITNDIRYIPQQDYEKVLWLYIDYLSQRLDMVSIYQIGAISVPGISDIDLIIVLDDRTSSVLDFREAQRAAAGELGLYAFSHSPFVVNCKTFRNLPTLFYAYNLRHLWGEKLTLNEYSSKEQEFYDYVIAVEAAIAQSFIFMRVTQDRTVFGLRSLLCNLNAIKHTISTIRRWRRPEDIGGSQVFMDQVDELRQGWFGHGPRHDFGAIAGLSAEALHILGRVLDELGVVGRDKRYLKDGCGEVYFSILEANVLLHFGPRAHVGVGHIRNPLHRLCEWPWIGGKLKARRRLRGAVSDISVLNMPSDLFSIIGFWGDANGPLGRILADRILAPRGTVEPVCSPAINRLLLEREASLNAYLQFAEGTGISGFLSLTPATWIRRPRTYGNRLKTALNTYIVRRTCRTGLQIG